MIYPDTILPLEDWRYDKQMLVWSMVRLKIENKKTNACSLLSALPGWHRYRTKLTFMLATWQNGGIKKCRIINKKKLRFNVEPVCKELVKRLGTAKQKREGIIYLPVHRRRMMHSIWEYGCYGHSLVELLIFKESKKLEKRNIRGRSRWFVMQIDKS